MKIRIKNSKYICNFTDINEVTRVIVSNSTVKLAEEIKRILGFIPQHSK